MSTGSGSDFASAGRMNAKEKDRLIKWLGQGAVYLDPFQLMMLTPAERDVVQRQIAFYLRLIQEANNRAVAKSRSYLRTALWLESG